MLSQSEELIIKRLEYLTFKANDISDIMCLLKTELQKEKFANYLSYNSNCLLSYKEIMDEVINIVKSK